MNFLNRFGALIIFVVFISKTCEAQQIQKLEQIFSKKAQIATEKIFVHTDKSQYFASEQIWFKVYVLDGILKKKSSLSKVAYVELLANDDVVFQNKLLLNNGEGSGTITLNSQLTGGKYILRCYTNYMKNGGQSVFFEKEIVVMNTFSLEKDFKKADTSQLDIRFFPEGGDMVENLSTTIGFKITNSKGKGVDFVGSIVDDRNDTVAKIKTFKFGIGRFNLVPKSGRSYNAIFYDARGAKITVALPKSKNKGLLVNVVDLEAAWRVSISSNTNEQGVYAVIHNGGKISDARAVSLINGAANVDLLKVNFEEGLHAITIFDNSGKPMAERLFYKPVTNKLPFKLNVNKNVFNIREEVNLSVLTEKLKIDTTDVSASLSVYKLDDLQFEEDIDIVSYLNLTSELKGKIESPAYYIKTNDAETKLAIDNLLLTQGWRRFNWEVEKQGPNDILKFKPEHEGMLISGTLQKSGSAITTSTRLFLSSPKNNGFFFTTTPDSAGKFTFNAKSFFDKNEIVVQIDSKQDTTSGVQLNNPFFSSNTKNALKPVNYLDIIKNEEVLRNYHFASQVEEIFSQNDLKEINRKEKEKFSFYGKPYKSYLIDEYTKFNTVEDILREYVSEIFVVRRQKGLDLKVVSSQGPFEQAPLILVDEMPYFEVSDLMKISPERIERLDVVIDKYYYGGQAYNGILSVKTKDFQLSDYKINPKSLILDYQGLQRSKEFYSPVYDSDDKLSSPMPDYRSTLIWLPFLKLTSDKEEKIRFYTSDFEGNYRVVIQGLSENGTSGSASIDFSVKAKSQ